MAERIAGHTAGPWDYIASTEHHGPYVAGPHGDICDCYAMSNPNLLSVRNGGTSRPIPFQGEQADANARLIAAAPELLAALQDMAALTVRKGIPGRWADALTKADAAIAKATSP